MPNNNLNPLLLRMDEAMDELGKSRDQIAEWYLNIVAENEHLLKANNAYKREIERLQKLVGDETIETNSSRYDLYQDVADLRRQLTSKDTSIKNLRNSVNEMNNYAARLEYQIAQRDNDFYGQVQHALKKFMIEMDQKGLTSLAVRNNEKREFYRKGDEPPADVVTLIDRDDKANVPYLHRRDESEWQWSPHRDPEASSHYTRGPWEQVARYAESKYLEEL